MKLITETIEDVNVLTETVKGEGKKYFIEGIFLQGGIKNRNGRIYPENILNEKVQGYINDFVETGRAYGELGHPSNPQINLERVSHLITSLKQDGADWIGKARIGNEGMGKIACSILEMGGKLGVSSRALGSLMQKEGYNEVQNDLHLVTAADIVADPSAPNAFVQGIMEDKEWVCEGGIWKTVSAMQKGIVEKTRMNVEQIIKDTPHDRVLREEAFVRLFYNFMSKISK